MPSPDILWRGVLIPPLYAPDPCLIKFMISVHEGGMSSRVDREWTDQAMYFVC